MSLRFLTRPETPREMIGAIGWWLALYIGAIATASVVGVL